MNEWNTIDKNSLCSQIRIGLLCNVLLCPLGALLSHVRDDNSFKDSRQNKSKLLWLNVGWGSHRRTIYQYFFRREFFILLCSFWSSVVPLGHIWNRKLNEMNAETKTELKGRRERQTQDQWSQSWRSRGEAGWFIHEPQSAHYRNASVSKQWAKLINIF